MLITGIGVTEEERLADLRVFQTRHCEKTKDYLMNYSQLVSTFLWVYAKRISPFVSSGPSVVFMLKHLKESGCEVPKSNVLCAPCDLTRSGGFTPDPGAVVLCSGQFFSESHMEQTLVHELMHMYDHCRFKVDWNNLRHHACSEVKQNIM
jgi:inner membrane protease ATP23